MKNYRHLFIVGLFLLVTPTLCAQITINSQFKPFTYEQMMAPIQSATQAHNNALNQLYEYEDRAIEFFKKGNYEQAKAYYKKMLDLNYRFNGNLCESKNIKEAIEACDKAISYTKAKEEINTIHQQAMQYYRARDYTSARNAFKQCKAIESSYGGAILKEGYIDACIEQINAEERYVIESRQITDVSSQCSYKASKSARPITKTITYQTKGNNKHCKIIGISLSTTETIVEFEYTNTKQNGWCNLSPSTYLLDKRTNKRYTMLYCEGITLAPGKKTITRAGEKITFKIVFPAIPTTTYYTDVVESEESSWQFLNIKIR